jgi:FkbM family methyltransferase
MSQLAGPAGSVHAFEPVPKTFSELERNRTVAEFPERIFANNLALGDSEGTVTINLFDGLPSGHASLSAKGGSVGSSFECRMMTLDRYMTDNNVGDVNFVKADIEGAEMMFLRGAGRLFEQSVPPVFLMEMALAQTKEFGYLPNDLISFIKARGNYSFYKVDEDAGSLIAIGGFEDDDIGANVFCVPSSAPQTVHDAIAKYLVK